MSQNQALSLDFHLALELPAVYKVWPGGGDQAWRRWGWCHAKQMARIINDHHGLNWDELDLISRFGLEKQTAMKVHKFGLRILEIPNASLRQDAIRGQFQLREYSSKLLFEYLGKKPNIPNFWVPAGWAKEVCWAMYNGGRRVKMENDPGDLTGKHKVAVVAEENGEGIFCF